jgi:hypothetical protein
LTQKKARKKSEKKTFSGSGWIPINYSISVLFLSSKEQLFLNVKQIEIIAKYILRHEVPFLTGAE